MIGVVGSETGAMREALARTDLPVLTDSPASVLDADPDVIIAVGRSAIARLIANRSGNAPPVLAIGASDGLPTVDIDAAPVDRLSTGQIPTVTQPTLSVRSSGEVVGEAVFDAMMVSSDPGEIGEYWISNSGERHQVRADGVVVATPAGSHDYARAAGGPRLETARPLASVVPVGAFTMSPRRWVVDLEDSIGIGRRRSVQTELLLDGRSRPIPDDGTIEIHSGSPIEFVDIGAI